MQEQLRSGTPININGMSSSHQPQQTPPSPQYFIGSATPESLPGANMFGFQEHMNSSGHNTFSQGFPVTAGVNLHCKLHYDAMLTEFRIRPNKVLIGQVWQDTPMLAALPVSVIWPGSIAKTSVALASQLQLQTFSG